MKWYLYSVPMHDRQMVMGTMEDGSVVSGFADSVPEYLAWLEEGNEPEEWVAPEA